MVKSAALVLEEPIIPHFTNLCLPRPTWVRNQFHGELGHFDMEKTLDKLKDLYWFPKMRKFVKKYVKFCLECAYNKIPGGKNQGNEAFPVFYRLSQNLTNLSTPSI